MKRYIFWFCFCTFEIYLNFLYLPLFGLDTLTVVGYTIHVSKETNGAAIKTSCIN